MLERFNREIARGTDVVGTFQDDQSLIRLLSMPASQGQRWSSSRRAPAHNLTDELSGELLHHLPGLD